MQRYVASRLIQMLPVLLLVSFVPYALLLLLPGDPVIAILGGSEGIEADPQLVRQLREDLALDDPIPVQYIRWLLRAFQGDFGEELSSGKPVLDLVARRLPTTVQLSLMSIAISVSMGVVLGLIAAVLRGSVIDMSATVFALVGVALPNFWLGLLLVLFFAVQLGWFRVIGFVPFLDDPLASLKSMLLPAITLGTGGAAVIARMTRSSMLEVLAQDYVRTARAKSLQERSVLVRHALRNALLPVLTVAGLQLSNIFSGSVIVESIFSLPGIGRLLVTSILHREFFVVQCVVLIIAVGVAATNLLVDILYKYVDPRIKYV